MQISSGQIGAVWENGITCLLSALMLSWGFGQSYWEFVFWSVPKKVVEWKVSTANIVWVWNVSELQSYSWKACDIGCCIRGVCAGSWQAGRISCCVGYVIHTSWELRLQLLISCATQVHNQKKKYTTATATLSRFHWWERMPTIPSQKSSQLWFFLNFKNYQTAGAVGLVGVIGHSLSTSLTTVYWRR